ncbi:MAG: 4-hydroxy-tetrahydrodipicolinate reductase [Rhodoglobus sp.]
MTIRVAVVGATGKLGRLVSQIIESAPDLEIFARLNSQSALSDMLGADVVVDVSLPDVSPVVVDFAIEHGMNVLVGTSGWSQERVANLEITVARTPSVGVLLVSNFSLGSVLATIFSTVAARFFDSIEILEVHHPSKVDAPSGTAVRTAELMAAARAGMTQLTAPGMNLHARGSDVAGIAIHSLRLQGVSSKQDVIFGGNSEVLTISHETLSSQAYEAGILLAVRAVGQCRGVVVGLDKLMDLDLSGDVAGPATN